MANNRLFLDTNVFIEFFESRGQGDFECLNGKQLFVSPLSVHVLAYVYKYKIPSLKLEGLEDQFQIINFGADIVQKALQGPTNDFEDNVQLHSGVAGGCDLFVTNDKKLLKMGYFGKMRIFDVMGD